jgi:hypothetical protein
MCKQGNDMKMKSVVIATMICGMSTAAFAEQYTPLETLATLDVSFADNSWDGETVPDGQHCKMFEGNGSSPSLNISNIPKGSNAILVSFNDKSFKMNDNGGHGIVGIWLQDGQTSMVVPSVAGETNNLPGGMFTEEKFRSTRGKDGAYLPPCSGGRGNLYDATIRAVYKSTSGDNKSTLLAEGVISLGKY